MKTMLMTAMAGAVMTVSGMAQDMSAKIPFGFTAHKGKMEAGSYKLIQQGSVGGARTYAMRNVASHTGVLILASPMTTDAAQRPHLKFECATSNDCVMSELWTGGAVGYRFATPKRVGDGKPEVRIVELTRY